MAQSSQGRKTITVSGDIHGRLEDAKPYESLSYGEFIGELLDQYESKLTHGTA